MDVVSFDMPVWTSAVQVPAGGRGALTCPVCAAPLALHQPDDQAPSRVLATCTCEDCTIWLALVFTADGRRVYMFRIPSVAEFREALSRRGGANGAAPV